jgi:hypothetical protein
MDTNAPDDRIYLNGISGVDPGYLVQPFSLAELRDRARDLRRNERFSSEDHLSALKTKGDPAGATYPIPADASPEKLQTVGWGMIFPAEADPNHVAVILEALSELVALRKEQAGERFRIFSSGYGYHRNDTADGFVARHGSQPGTPDVDRVPYYLLLVADPQSIPYQFQYELDVQFGVGRIYFETADEYAQYARSVLLSETPGQVCLAPQAVFFGVANKSDPATNLSAQSLIAPLYNYTLDKCVELGWNQPTLVQPAEATKNNLANFLGGDRTPALLFSASHGVGWPYGHAHQYPFQGALVTQDWPGPTVPAAPTRDMYFGAEDLDSQASLLGTIAFFFACFGGGTPYWDDYAVARNRRRQALARRAFMAALPLRMLSHPRGGALAVIAHVERAWGYSFRWQGSAAEPKSFQNLLYQLMKGIPIGYATEHLNLRYAQFATMLSSNFENAKYERNFDPLTISTNWLATNDARGYAVIGDPAVKIPVSGQGTTPSRPTIARPKHGLDTLPVVLVRDAAPAGEQPDTEGEIPSQAPPDHQPARPPNQGPGGGNAPAAAFAVPYASPVDGLAFALQAYTGEGQVSFATGGEAGVEYSIRDDAKNMVRDVVVNLNSALQNLSRRLLDATSQALTLKVTTSLVENLDTYDPLKPDAQKAVARFKTTISATGDIQVFLPSRAEAIDDVLMQVHKDMVEQAMHNRMETVKAIGELVASLFSPLK